MLKDKGRGNEARQKGRKINLGVARDVKHLAGVKSGVRTWWCASADAQKGDIIVVYKKLAGIGWVLEVIDQRFEDEMLCELYDMLTVNVKVVMASDRLIDAKALKDNEILSQTPAVRGNFQSSLFNMSEPELKEVLRMLGTG